MLLFLIIGIYNLNNNNKYNFKNYLINKNIYLMFIKMGIGDWGLGIRDWAQSPIPNPQSPIPNPQSPTILFF